MDLVASAENIIVAMMHTNKHGESKILKKCSLPLTGVGCVTKVVTNLAVLEVKNNQFYLLERAPGVSVEDIQKATEGTLIINGEVPEMNIQYEKIKAICASFISSFDTFNWVRDL